MHTQNHAAEAKSFSVAIMFMIIGLSFFSTLVIALLAQLALPKAFGLALITSGAISAFLSTKTKRKTFIKEISKEKMVKREKRSFKKSEIDKNFVSLGVDTSGVSKITKPEIEIPEKKELVEEKDTEITIEIFQQDPIGQLTETQLSLMDLLDKSHNAFIKLEEVFGSRLHKNTSSDISNYLLLQRLNDAFKLRLEEIIDTLDTIKKEQKLNAQKGFELAHGSLVLANDTISSLSEASAEILPIEKKDWDQTLEFLLKQITRKKTFHQALSTSRYI